jgi:hypothetical protein
MCGELGGCRRGEQHEVGGKPVGVGPQVAGAGEREPVDHLDRRTQYLDRMRRRGDLGVFRALADQVGIGDDTLVQRQRLIQRSGQPLRPVWWLAPVCRGPGSILDDVGERGVANVDFPQRGACPRLGDVEAMGGELRDQLDALRSFERAAAAVAIDDRKATHQGRRLDRSLPEVGRQPREPTFHLDRPSPLR